MKPRRPSRLELDQRCSKYLLQYLLSPASPLLLTFPTTTTTSRPGYLDISGLQSLLEKHHGVYKMASATNFPASVVPQAPEDPLFGLMRAFRADESEDKVDLVSSGSCPLYREEAGETQKTVG